jgi:hypothetical protein
VKEMRTTLKTFKVEDFAHELISDTEFCAHTSEDGISLPQTENDQI